MLYLPANPEEVDVFFTMCRCWLATLGKFEMPSYLYPEPAITVTSLQVFGWQTSASNRTHTLRFGFKTRSEKQSKIRPMVIAQLRMDPRYLRPNTEKPNFDYPSSGDLCELIETLGLKETLDFVMGDRIKDVHLKAKLIKELTGAEAV